MKKIDGGEALKKTNIIMKSKSRPFFQPYPLRIHSGHSRFYNKAKSDHGRMEIRETENKKRRKQIKNQR